MTELEQLKQEIARAREETRNLAREKDLQIAELDLRIAELKKELLNKITTDNLIVNSNIGIGVEEPVTEGQVTLEVAGNILFNRIGDAGIFTGVGNQELNRYLQLLNSPEAQSASGLKAGGVLVSDSYSFANPGKNNLVVKGNVGIGVKEPVTEGQVKLEVAGNILFNRIGDAKIFTGVGNQELNRYLQLLNSPEAQSASGLKAGGVLVSDSYSFANPGKNDLVVKGNVGIGVKKPETKANVKLEVAGNILFYSGDKPSIFTGLGTRELNRYLQLLNSPEAHSASGLKAGGVLVSDNYSFANPGKNDLVVKGNAEINGEISQTKKITTENLIVNGEIRGKLWYSKEYVWEQGQSPVRMNRSDRTVAFLTFVKGKFYGGGEFVKVYESGGYWYLGGDSQQHEVEAKARCIGMP